MSPITKKDAVIRAQVLTKSLEDKTINKGKVLFEHSATYISIFAIVMIIVLYAFNTGNLREYNIPVECMKLDLRSYIPLATQMIGVSLWGLYYISYVKTDKVLKKNRFHLLRAAYGALIILTIMNYNHLYIAFGSVTVIIISIVIPVAIELIHYCFSKPARNKVISDIEYNMLVEDYTYNNIFNAYFIKCGIFVIIIAVTIAPLLGRISAKSKLEYQVCENMGIKYAVIIDYGDRVLAEKVSEAEKQLTIDTSSYHYFLKDDMTFEYKEYESVVIN